MRVGRVGDSQKELLSAPHPPRSLGAAEELLALGLSNLVGAMHGAQISNSPVPVPSVTGFSRFRFSSYPVTGSFSRSASASGELRKI